MKKMILMIRILINRDKGTQKYDKMTEIFSVLKMKVSKYGFSDKNNKRR